MDVDDDVIVVSSAATTPSRTSLRGATPPRASHGAATSPRASSQRKSVSNENKAKPKSKKAKSWSTAAAGGDSSSKHTDASAFSFHRIRTLMKTQSSVQNITHDTTYLVAKATESFISDIALQMAEEALVSNGMNGSQQNGSSGDHSLVVTYDHLADIVHSTNRLGFLKDFVPRKVLVGQVLPELGKKSNDVNRSATPSGVIELDDDDSS